MRQLDRSRPYAEIHGLPGALYTQDGFNFRHDGREALDISPIVEEPPAYSGPEINPPAVSCIEQPTDCDGSEKEKPLEEMHWRHLKALVESYGGEWTNRAEAIAFLQRD